MWVVQSAHITDKNTSVLQSSTDAPRVEHYFCSETSVWCSDDKVVSINIEGEEIHLKEEVEPFSSIKDKPQVSPQTFHWYLGLPSVIVPFVCLPYHLNLLPVVNGNGLYIFTVYVKYGGLNEN